MPWEIVEKVGVLPILPTIKSCATTKLLTSTPLLLVLEEPQVGCHPLKSPPMMMCAFLWSLKNNSKRFNVLSSSTLGSMYSEITNNFLPFVINWTMLKFWDEYFDMPRVAAIPDLIITHALTLLFLGN